MSEQLLSKRLSPATIARLQRWINLHRVLWVLTIACFFVAWNRGLALLYGIFSLILALLLISQLMPWLQLRGIRVRRSLPPELTVGSKGRIDYLLTASGRRYHLEVSDNLPFAETNQKLFFSHSDRDNKLSLDFLCQRRGCFRLQELTVSSAYPFGIVTRSRRLLTAPLDALVLPRVYALNAIPMPLVAQGGSDGEVHVPLQGGHDEFAAVREYSHGDELRSIHWRASARQQQLVVKEYERSDRPVLLLALDCRPAFNLGEGTLTTFEHAISIAASMIHYASRDGMQSILVTDDGQWQERIIPAYSADLYSLYEFLARLDASGTLSSASLVEQALARFPRANLITSFRLRRDSDLPAIPPYLTHIDLELDAESFLFPLRGHSRRTPHRSDNRLTYPVELHTPIEGLFQ